ncbi:MAG: nucleotidyltransferase [Caldilinea sp.]|nr:nucleotidyltransferase [Caldilinea sp.]MCB0069055.1 nucleotidyltransferase [Caldilineaceae bacterium]MCB9125310.1 nucleotidyltransferase [Caldilineaceae bacterium]MCO5210433.1 nucleotidyltransferase [Caldilinea sp.]MCW5840196.1 nucleotidyltransferase [Caldilinea sp.]
MSSPAMLEPLLAPLAAIQRVIEKLENRGVIIGGIAASLLGEPRLTADADALVLLSIDEVPLLIELAQAEGLHPRFADIVEFARRSRVVLLRHPESGIDVDISLGLLPFEIEAVERSQEHRAGSLTVRLPTPEDLIILKAVAHRQKDMLDIEAVIAAQPHLDKERIAFWVRQFAELLEMPELWTDVERLLDNAPS